MSVTVKDDRRQYDRLRRDLNRLGSLRTTVGVHDDAGMHGLDGVTVAEIAAVHEFGEGRIPQRSFLRKTFDEREGAIRGVLEDGIADVIAERFTPQQVMDKAGMIVRGMVQTAIQAGIEPPLSEMTIASRDAKAKHGGGLQSLAGQHTPLIDTGQLLSSITHTVEAE